MNNFFSLDEVQYALEFIGRNGWQFFVMALIVTFYGLSCGLCATTAPQRRRRRNLIIVAVIFAVILFIIPVYFFESQPWTIGIWLAEMLISLGLAALMSWGVGELIKYLK